MVSSDVFWIVVGAELFQKFQFNPCKSAVPFTLLNY